MGLVDPAGAGRATPPCATLTAYATLRRVPSRHAVVTNNGTGGSANGQPAAWPPQPISVGHFGPPTNESPKLACPQCARNQPARAGLSGWSLHCPAPTREGATPRTHRVAKSGRSRPGRSDGRLLDLAETRTLALGAAVQGMQGEARCRPADRLLLDVDPSGPSPRCYATKRQGPHPDYPDGSTRQRTTPPKRSRRKSKRRGGATTSRGAHTRGRAGGAGATTPRPQDVTSNASNLHAPPTRAASVPHLSCKYMGNLTSAKAYLQKQ